MPKLNWAGAEDVLFERSCDTINRFAREHATELVSLFAYTVDSEYAGVGINFDTPVNSLQRAMKHQRDQVHRLNNLFSSARGWESARYYVANQVDVFNRHGSWRHELVEFVQLNAWEKYYTSNEEAPDLEGRVIASLWRVTDRLVDAGAFDGLKRAAPFRIGFEFHDAELVVLRILDWPEVGPQ